MQKLDQEEKCVLDFDKTILFSSYEYFCRGTKEKIVGYLSNKTKTGAFLENRRNNFSDIEKNFPKTKFQTNFIWFRAIGAPRSLEDIGKLGTIWEQFAWQIFSSFL